jgi:hypothetical protein
VDLGSLRISSNSAMRQPVSQNNELDSALCNEVYVGFCYTPNLIFPTFSNAKDIYMLVACFEGVSGVGAE